jgi:hypothetical protein
VEIDYSMQVLLQLWVTRLQTAFCIVALPGTSSLSGKICYIVMGNLSLAYANDFFHQYLDRIGKLLQPIYAMSTVDEVLEMTLAHLESCLVQLFKN